MKQQNRSIPVGVSNQPLTFLKMPKQYRRYVDTRERCQLRSDNLKISREIVPTEGRNKQVRMKIDDYKDGESYTTEKFYEDSAYAHVGTMVLLKQDERYTLVFPERKYTCSKMESDQVKKQKIEKMDHKLDARRKVADFELIIQDKIKKVQNLPMLKQTQLVDNDDSDSLDIKKNKKQFKNLHRIKSSDVSESEQIEEAPKKKINRKSEDEVSSDSDLADESLEEEVSVSQ